MDKSTITLRIHRKMYNDGSRRYQNSFAPHDVIDRDSANIRIEECQRGVKNHCKRNNAVYRNLHFFCLLIAVVTYQYTATSPLRIKSQPNTPPEMRF